MTSSPPEMILLSFWHKPYVPRSWPQLTLSIFIQGSLVGRTLLSGIDKDILWLWRVCGLCDVVRTHRRILMVPSLFVAIHEIRACLRRVRLFCCPSNGGCKCLF